VPIFWPLFSPDLSLIESIWDIMKDTLQEIDLELHRKFKRLRGAVLRAWNALIYAEIRAEISTMRQRCQDVIDTQGMETKW
jgi:transposase